MKNYLIHTQTKQIFLFVINRDNNNTSSVNIGKILELNFYMKPYNTQRQKIYETARLQTQ